MKIMLALLSFVFGLSPISAEPFELKDGDKVVWLGSTLIEREQRYGYWETALTARWPDRNITFRNLGWSGDNVYGEARLAFDITNPALGLKRMVDLTLAEKPTVIFICYGTNESFEGEAGLAKFEKGYEKLLDALAPTKARIVLMAPPMFEEAMWKGSDYQVRKNELKRYTEVISRLANNRKLWLVKEFVERHGVAGIVTENGVHFTAYGYWTTAGCLATELRLGYRTFKSVELTNREATQITQDVLQQPANPLGQATLLTGDTLKEPVDSASHGGFQADCAIRVPKLAPGKYTLTIDGQAILTEDAATWMKPYHETGVWVGRGPSLDQAEQLRQAIIEKNQLYFYRWRPQNETYLFGFRKHEQGKNAKEVAEYDPLIAAKEKEIAKLRVPKTHRYEIVPVEKK